MQSFGLLFVLFVSQCLAQSHPWVARAGDSAFMSRHQLLLNQTAQHKNDIKMVFLGDSIIRRWEDQEYGLPVFTQYYTPKHAYNYGLGGDVTEGVLYRIANKEFDGLSPTVTVLMIGTNNLGGNTVEDIAHGIKEILTQLLVKMSSTKIILLGVLPRDGSAGAKAKQLNTLIAKFDDNSKIFWLDMWSQFESANGKQKTELYVSDKLHLNTAGYEVWQKTMEPLLNQLYPTL